MWAALRSHTACSRSCRSLYSFAAQSEIAENLSRNLGRAGSIWRSSFEQGHDCCCCHEVGALTFLACASSSQVRDKITQACVVSGVQKRDIDCRHCAPSQHACLYSFAAHRSSCSWALGEGVLFYLLMSCCWEDHAFQGLRASCFFMQLGLQELKASVIRCDTF